MKARIKFEIVANNEEFRDLDNKIGLKHIGVSSFNNEFYQVYYSFTTSKFYLVNPEKRS